MGDVSLLTSSLQRALRGEPVDPSKLLRFVRRAGGIPANKRKAAIGAIFFASDMYVEERCEAAALLEDMLEFEESNGPRAKEPLCPDSKAGIYGLAEVAIVTYGLRQPANSFMRRLADRQLALTGQRLALYDLIATPDGDVTGLPGVRSNSPKGPTRMCETMEYRVLMGLPQKGNRGTGRTLESFKPTTDAQAIFSAPAWWWSRLGRDKLQSRLVPCLPRALPLALVVYAWPTGTLAYFERPDNIKQWLTYGSAASRKDKDGVEDVCSSVLVNWKAPGRHEVKAILSWREEPPVGDVPAGAVMVRVPAVGENVKEGK